MNRLLSSLSFLFILVILNLSLSSSQPFDVSSYPSFNQLVPLPGDYFVADNPPTPSTQISAAASSPRSFVRNAESDAAACTTGWCTKTGQWLPTNITYVLIAIAALILTFGLRDDRKTCVIVLTWFASIYVLYLVNYTIAWYCAVGANFVAYHIVSSWETKTQADEDDIVEQIEEEEDMNELMDGVNQLIDPGFNDAQMLEKMDALEAQIQAANQEKDQIQSYSPSHESSPDKLVM